MELSHVPPTAGEPETLYDLLTTRVPRATPIALALIGMLGLGGGAAIFAIDSHRWAPALLLIAFGLVGVLGLVEQRAEQPHTRAVELVEKFLVASTVMGALAAMVGLMLRAMGASPIS